VRLKDSLDSYLHTDSELLKICVVSCK